MKIIPELRVSIQSLASALECAAIDFVINADSIYVIGEGFPFWITLDQARKFVQFRTHVATDPGADKSVLDAIANDCANKIMLPAFSHCDGRFRGCYNMSFDGGLSRRQFIKITRRFGDAFGMAINENDPDGVLGEQFAVRAPLN